MVKYVSGVLLLISLSSAEAGIRIEIDKSAQLMTVSVDGAHRYSWPVSTGRAGFATPSGSYRPFRMEVDHYSKEWDDAPMPHSIFFTKEGHAIHGSYETRRLGSPASHGCVRLAPRNAATLFALVQRHGLGSTTVSLSGTQPRARPAVRPRYQEEAPAIPPPAYEVQREQWQAPTGFDTPFGSPYGPRW
jgi:lipoprotein-anchoring transpeptidase ErfK/SrfK